MKVRRLNYGSRGQGDSVPPRYYSPSPHQEAPVDKESDLLQLPRYRGWVRCARVRPHVPENIPVPLTLVIGVSRKSIVLTPRNRGMFS